MVQKEDKSAPPINIFKKQNNNNNNTSAVADDLMATATAAYAEFINRNQISPRYAMINNNFITSSDDSFTFNNPSNLFLKCDKQNAKIIELSQQFYQQQHHNDLMITKPITSNTSSKYFEPNQMQYDCSAPIARNTPENNEVTIVEYRNENLASFNVDSSLKICLPQAFELFLKNLVGGLHTVYTKLKRLDIVPIVCNVEQVRVLRGLGAIQPGVNRCKLISPDEFDILYDDCTNSG
jgi:hypothetical protein